MIHIPLAISPCPNDTFIFDALINNLIDTEGFVFNPIFQDINSLNKLALQKDFPLIKISYGILKFIDHRYRLLSSGSAMGKGVGPLLVGLPQTKIFDLKNKKIGLPGEYTTAYWLFKKYFAAKAELVFLPFNQLMSEVLSENLAAAIIIHESRFTYKKLGLKLLLDLGQSWEKHTQLPLPLGGIVLHNTYNKYYSKINGLIKKSILYSFSRQFPNLSKFVLEKADEMSVAVIKQHIKLYVNELSLDIGEMGWKAIKEMVDLTNNNL